MNQAEWSSTRVLCHILNCFCSFKPQFPSHRRGMATGPTSQTTAVETVQFLWGSRGARPASSHRRQALPVPPPLHPSATFRPRQVPGAEPGFRASSGYSTGDTVLGFDGEDTREGPARPGGIPSDSGGPEDASSASHFPGGLSKRLCLHYPREPPRK